MVYRIGVVRAAQKEILALSQRARIGVAATIDGLAKIPRPAGCKKLRGTDFWRVRSGRHRIIYSIDDSHEEIVVLKVALRREDTYRGL